MNKTTKLILLVLGILIIFINLYVTFMNSEENEENAEITVDEEEIVSESESGVNTKSTSITNTLGSYFSGANKSQIVLTENQKQKKDNAKKQIQSKINSGNYLICGEGIQKCPPPKPAGQCKCNASSSLFNMFDGNH
jgi:flagellar basal body-associated protein FliL